MGQRYIRSVSTAGGLSLPTVVVDKGQTDTAYATQQFTYGASARVEIIVDAAEAECELYNGTSWNTGDVPLLVGFNSFDSNHQGIRVRSRYSENPALVTITRFTT